MALSKKQQAPGNYSLPDVLDLLREEIFRKLNCHAVGVVRAFNSLNQTATIAVAYKKTLFKVSALTNKYESTPVDYPLLIDCPVISLGGNLTSLTFPVTPGDECLVFFNDRDIDNWFAGSQVTQVNSLRMHSMADAIALVGIRSKSNWLADYDSVRAILKYKLGASVGVGPTKVLIENQTESLNDVLQDLVTTIKAIVTTNTADTVSAASQAALTAVAVRIGLLLE